jgi:hypothetical protein
MRKKQLANGNWQLAKKVNGEGVASERAMTPCSSPVPPCYELTPSGKKVHERPVESRF